MTYSRHCELLSGALGRLWGFGPSILLHPLNFLGGDDLDALRFFPAMRRPSQEKLRQLSAHLAQLAERFTIVPMGEHAAALEQAADVPERPARFRVAPAPVTA